jgi:hyperosmotically inducible protein
MKIQNTGFCVLFLCLGLSTTTVTMFTGCAGDKYNRSTGQYIDDKSVAVRVRDALHDNPDYKFDGVNVDVFRGTVQLSGFVNTSDEKSKAGDIAKNVQDVKKIVNNITVKETQ